MAQLMIKPRGFDQWNRALQGAYRKGWNAWVEQGSAAECPYEDKRKPSGKLSWSRAFMNAWSDGYYAAKFDEKQVRTTS